MDQIADLLNRIRNASLAGRFEVVASYSKMKEAILNILKNEGFLFDFKVEENEGKKSFVIQISKTKKPMHLKQISKPGRRIYAKNTDIPRPLRGLGTVIISTPNGVITGHQAKKMGIGGELICEIW